MKQIEFLKKMFKVGSIGFGGGSALIPVLESTFLKQKDSKSRKDFDRDIVVASITPGALPVELASGLGAREFGLLGMVTGACAMALPGALIAFLLFTILAGAQDAVLEGIRLISVGVSSYIICQLMCYMDSTLKICRKESVKRMRYGILVMAAVCLLSCGGSLHKLLGLAGKPVFGLNTVHILIAVVFVACYTRSMYDWFHILIAGALCLVFFLGHGKAGVLSGFPWILRSCELVMIILSVYGLFHGEREKSIKRVDRKGLFHNMGTWVIFLLLTTLPALICGREALAFIGRGSLSVLMSFGGGDAYLTIADGLFVDSGLISEDLYYGSVVSVVNLLPGSILTKCLTGIGYYMGIENGGAQMTGAAWALAGYGCSVAVSGISFHMFAYFYDTLTDSKIFRVVGRWIRPVISGLLMGIVLSLLNQNKNAAAYTSVPMPIILVGTILLALADYRIMRHSKISNLWIVALNLAAVLLLFLIP
ncbi:MAG: chromate transporter [Clostridiales bacterium]|nr:chromate transporter [Clostridiales bacterium]